MTINDKRLYKYVKSIVASPDIIIIAIVKIVILTVFNQPSLIFNAIAKITVIPIDIGCKPNVYAPAKAKTIPIKVDKATSLIYEIERIIEGCIDRISVITA